MKKLSIYLALVAGWASTQPAAPLTKIGLVMGQAIRTVPVRAGLPARAQVRLGALTRTIVQRPTPTLTFTRCNHSNKQKSDTFNKLASIYHLEKILYDTIPQKQKLDLITDWIKKNIENLDINSISYDTLCTLLDNLPESDPKTAWIMRLLATADINSMSYDTLCTLLDNLPESDAKTAWIMQLLTSAHINSMAGDKLYILLSNLPESDAKNAQFMKLLTTAHINSMSKDALRILLWNLPKSDAKTAWIMQLLTTGNIDSMPDDTLIILLSNLPKSDAKITWIQKQLTTADINSISYEKLNTLLWNLPESDTKTGWIMQHLTTNHIDSISNDTLRILLGNLPESKRHLLKEELKEQLIQRNLVLKTLFDPTLKDQGPLFCQTFNNNNFDKFLDHPWCVFHELLPLISEYVAEEYRQNRIVFFHGQSSVWPFFSDMYRELISLTSGQDFPKDFIHLRFTTQATLTEKDVAYLTQQGVESTPHRPNLLFVNLHLFSNGDGSNSFRYVTNNSDQSTNHDRADFITHVTAIFKEAGCQAELPLLEKELFELKGLYDAAIQEQGNKGTLLVISMPPEIASEIAYSAKPGGFINPITIDGKPTTDPTLIAKNYDQVDFENEYCICLTDRMVDPKNAQQAGIKMKAFDPAITWQTCKTKAYKAALAEFIQKVQTLRNARLEREKTN
mgnify:CR=1 FL=1